MVSAEKKLGVLSLVYDLRHGGDENRLLGFARHVDRKHFNHAIVTIMSPNAELDGKFGSMRDEFVKQGVLIKDLGMPAGNKSSNVLQKLVLLVRLLRRLRRMFRELDIDVLDAHLRDASLVGVLATVGTRVRITQTLYGIHEWRDLTSFRQRIGRCVMRMFDMLITDSNARRSDVQDWLGKPHPRFEVIPNGVDPPTAERCPQEIRALLGLSACRNGTIIGAIARLVPFKGHMCILEAAKLLLKQSPDAFFVMIGFAPQSNGFDKHLKQKAAALGISDSVYIGGYPGPIGDVWQLIDIHLHATEYDSLPNAIIEAMSLAKPSVVTSVGGIPDMVEHGETGLVVPPNDPQAVAKGLLKLIERPDLATQLGQNALARYQQRYRPDLVARQLESVFQSITE